jgi:hypothetical protein
LLHTTMAGDVVVVPKPPVATVAMAMVAATDVPTTAPCATVAAMAACDAAA